MVSVNNGGLISTSGPGGLSSSTITITNTIANINQILNGLIFQTPNAGATGAYTLTISENDRGNTGSGAPLTSVSNIAIQAITDTPPSIPGASYSPSLTYNENPTGSMLIASNIIVNDPDVIPYPAGAFAAISISPTTFTTSSEDLLQYNGSVNNIALYGSGFDPNTGVLILQATGSATAADFQNALRQVVYKNTSRNPSVTPRTISIVVNDGYADSSTISATNISVGIVPSNDAPIVTLSAASLTYTEKDPATPIDPLLTLFDYDSPFVASATVTIANGFAAGGEDILAFTNQLGIVGAYSNGVLTLTGSGTSAVPIANMQAALRTVTYRDTSSNPSTTNRSIRFSVTDVDAVGNLSPQVSLPVSRTIIVVPINDPPVVTVASSQRTYFELNNPILIDSTLTISDVDNSSMASAIVSISNNFSAGQDVLTFSASGSIVGNYNATTGVLTFSGVDTLANYQQTLQSVRFSNSSHNPSTAIRTITFSANDGLSSSSTLLSSTRTVQIVPTNDAPMVTTSLVPTVFIENSPALLLDSSVQVFDYDSVSQASAVVQIVAGFAPGEDTLLFTNQLGIVGNYDGSSGTLTLIGSSTVANYQQALRSIRYANTSQNPSTATRTISYTVSDGALNSLSSNLNLTVISVNDPPTMAIPNLQQNNKGHSLFFSSANGNAISVSDVDSGNSQIDVTLTAVDGTITLGSLAGISIIGGTNGSSSVTFRGSVAAINSSALEGLAFNPPATFEGATFINMSVNDLGFNGTGGPQAVSGVVSIMVSTFNQPPLNVLPTTPSTVKNTPLVFSSTGSPINQISVNDPDAGIDPIRVSLTVTNGVLKLPFTNGVTLNTSNAVATGSGTNAIVITGSQQNISAVMDGMQFVPNAGFVGTAALTMTSNDLGSSGTGGAQTDFDNLTIFVVDNSIQVNGSTLVLTGTAIDDTLSVIFSTLQAFTVTLNGTVYNGNTLVTNNIVFHGNAGNDRVTVVGQSFGFQNVAESAAFSYGGITVAGAGYAFSADSSEYIDMYGSALSVATFTDSPGNDWWRATSFGGRMDSPGSVNNAIGFGTVSASSLNGGNDIGQLFDSVGNDTFTIQPNYATIQNAVGSYGIAQNFKTVYGFGSSGTDVANIYDTAGNDNYFGLPAYSIMGGSGNYFAQATNFKSVFAYASTGTDTATCFDSVGNDTFSALPSYSIMTGAGYSYQATGFDSTAAFSSAGTDNATFYDSSSSDDYFTASPTFANMFKSGGGGFNNQAFNFRNVVAYATQSGANKNYAILSDSAGNDTFNSNGGVASLSGSNYSIQVNSFDFIFAQAINGGNDSATFADTAGADTIFAGGSQMQFLNNLCTSTLTGFKNITANSTRGGFDQKHVTSIDFILQTFGPWSKF